MRNSVGQTQGYILLAFEFFREYDEGRILPKPIYPNRKPCWLQFSCLGVRDVVPTSGNNPDLSGVQLQIVVPSYNSVAKDDHFVRRMKFPCQN